MKNSKFMTLALVIIIATMSVFFIACPPADNGGTDGDTVTTLFSETATKVAAVDLYIRGNMTGWALPADPSDDLQFSEYSDGSYRATVDFANINGDTSFTGRPRFKFSHQKNVDAATWTDAQTINGFDPNNTAGDPETDLLSTYTDTPKENGCVIGKIKGGMKNMTIFQDGGKYTFRVANLVVPATMDELITSTHADEYVLIDTVVVRAGTDILPTDRIHPTQNVGIGGDFTATAWDPANADSLLTKDDANKKFSKTFTLTAGNKSFAICNPSWDYKWDGITIWEVTADATKKVGVAVPLVAGGENATFVVTNAGDYEFVVDYTDVKAPTLTINKK